MERAHYVTACCTQGKIRVEENLTTNLERFPLLLFRRRKMVILYPA